ncbi:MAG: hypothetical protein C7B47_14075 [Sulfobacillus thermosulfidooxidans]|uniref:PD-(D/E)XK nuclease superfamily protein n=1 Tax=Sulfobacillus thermosulfidooxidans TaxID=28034 RepID=A0A2T2WR66_SULTH|nr:MAG: hypothetical protein C7B47_14075 [Sulfobacillus thermosulfidooxidans]
MISDRFPAPLGAWSTERLQQAHLEAVLTGPSKFNPHEIRLSEAGQCPRRQTLRALGYVPTPPTRRDLAIFETGHLAEDRIAALWEAQFPGQVQREVEVSTDFGVGHIDLWIAPLAHLVECKTTTEKRLHDLPLASHVAQVTLYLHFFGNAHGATAEISYLLKETGEIHSFPVVYDRDLARQLVIGLMEVQQAITLFREPLPIPDAYQATQFPCAWHSPQGLRRCGFWDFCWGQQIGTATEKTDTIVVAPPLQPDVEEYAALRTQQQALEGHLDIVKERRRMLEATFRDFLTAQGATALRAGEITVKRAVIPGRTTIDWKAVLADGLVTESVLQPYQHTGAAYDRWTLRTRPSHNPSRRRSR